MNSHVEHPAPEQPASRDGPAADHEGAAAQTRRLRLDQPQHRLDGDRGVHRRAAARSGGGARPLTPDAPVLRIRFTPHDVSDRPLVYSEMFFRGDAFSYKAVVKR